MLTYTILAVAFFAVQIIGIVSVVPMDCLRKAFSTKKSQQGATKCESR